MGLPYESGKQEALGVSATMEGSRSTTIVGSMALGSSVVPNKPGTGGGGGAGRAVSVAAPAGSGASRGGGGAGPSTAKRKSVVQLAQGLNKLDAQASPDDDVKKGKQAAKSAKQDNPPGNTAKRKSFIPSKEMIEQARRASVTSGKS